MPLIPVNAKNPQNMKSISQGAAVFLIINFISALLTGCMALPVVGLANLVHKSGTMTMTLKGSNGISKFRSAALAEGAVVPTVDGEYARAEFADVDMKIDAQVIGEEIIMRGASLSNLGRTYATEDSISLKTEAVANRMVAKGMRLVSADRKRF